MRNLHALMLGPLLMVTLAHGDVELVVPSGSEGEAWELLPVPSSEATRRDWRSMEQWGTCMVLIVSLCNDDRGSAGDACHGPWPVSLSLPAASVVSRVPPYVRHDKGSVYLSAIEDGGDALDATFDMHLLNGPPDSCSLHP